MISYVSWVGAGNVPSACRSTTIQKGLGWSIMLHTGASATAFHLPNLSSCIGYQLAEILKTLVESFKSFVPKLKFNIQHLGKKGGKLIWWTECWRHRKAHIWISSYFRCPLTGALLPASNIESWISDSRSLFQGFREQRLMVQHTCLQTHKHNSQAVELRSFRLNGDCRSCCYISP